METYLINPDGQIDRSIQESTIIEGEYGMHLTVPSQLHVLKYSMKNIANFVKPPISTNCLDRLYKQPAQY